MASIQNDLTSHMSAAMSSAGLPSSVVGGSPSGTPSVVNGSVNRYLADENQKYNAKNSKELSSRRGNGKDQGSPTGFTTQQGQR